MGREVIMEPETVHELPALLRQAVLALKEPVIPQTARVIWPDQHSASDYIFDLMDQYIEVSFLDRTATGVYTETVKPRDIFTSRFFSGRFTDGPIRYKYSVYRVLYNPMADVLYIMRRGVDVDKAKFVFFHVPANGYSTLDFPEIDGWFYVNLLDPDFEDFSPPRDWQMRLVSSDVQEIQRMFVTDTMGTNRCGSCGGYGVDIWGEPTCLHTLPHCLTCGGSGRRPTSSELVKTGYHSSAKHLNEKE